MADHSTASNAACRVADPFRRILLGSNRMTSTRIFVVHVEYCVAHRVALIQINDPPGTVTCVVHRTNNRTALQTLVTVAYVRTSECCVIWRRP
jgi:hypothetical protein